MPKLNIGCGNVPLAGGYTNVDKYYYPGSPAPLNDNILAATWDKDHPDSPWIYGDAIDLKLPSDFFDEVIMVHMLEHLSMEHGNLAIREAYNVCKPGGFVEIEVPNVIVACQLLPALKPNTPLWYRVMGLLNGTTGIDGEGQFHLCGYSKDYLRFKMEERGFKNIDEIPVGYGHGNNDLGHAEPEFDFRLKGFK